MRKKENKTSPIKTETKVGKLVKINGTPEEKKIPRWNTVEVVLKTLKDGSIQGYLIGDGVPYPFWTHAYKNLEMTPAHATGVKRRLTEGKHYISIPKDEMLKIYPIINEALKIKFKPHEYVFLTEEGQERTLLEVNTSGMNNKEVAARINQRKDEMVSVFVKFKRGELVQVDAPPVIEKIKEKRDEGTHLNKQVARCVKDWLMPDYARKGLNPYTAFSDEHRGINSIVNGEHEKDLKNKLNSDGLDVHNTAKTSEISLIEAGIVDNERRWTITRRVIDNLYPMRHEKPLKLNEKELLLIKRGCNENQTSLFNFNQRKQIGSSI